MGSEIVRDEQLFNRRSTDLAATQAASAAEREKVLAPMEQQLQEKMAEPTPERRKVDIPQFQAKPVIDAKDYEALSYGLIAMAMIGGVASQGKWLEVGSVLNGALKGYLEGNELEATKRYKDYDEAFKGAIAAENQANREFEDILKDRHMRIGDQINAYRIVAAKYDRQDALAAVQSRSLDRMWQSLESRKTAMARLEESNARATESIALRREVAGPQEGHLTPEGEKVLQELVRAGKPIPKTNRGHRDDDTLNRLGAAGGSVVGDQAEYKANQSAYTQLTKDLAAIRPYKEMLDQNGDILIDLGKKVLRADSATANKTLNWLKQNAGDNPDTAEYLAQMAFFQTESARVLNNPRLVGQLTDSARSEMQHVISGNMPINATERVVRRIQKDGGFRVDKMQKEADALKAKLHGGAAAPAAKPPPGGVDPVLWEHMTPEEQALWK